MRIVQPSAELLSITPHAECLIERAGRTCYKSDIEKCSICNGKGEHDTPDGKIMCAACNGKAYVERDYNGNPDPDSASKFVDRILGFDPPHESVIEHAVATIKFVTDRGVTHELVRHRLASYSQESTRYCDYGKDKHGNEIAVIEPLFPDSPQGKAQRVCWVKAMQFAENEYMAMRTAGAVPEVARSVLPNSLKTEIVTTFNFREWSWFLQLRMGHRAHPQIRQIAYMSWLLLKNEAPSVFNRFTELANFANSVVDNIGGETSLHDKKVTWVEK